MLAASSKGCGEGDGDVGASPDDAGRRRHDGGHLGGEIGDGGTNGGRIRRRYRASRLERPRSPIYEETTGVTAIDVVGEPRWRRTLAT